MNVTLPTANVTLTPANVTLGPTDLTFCIHAEPAARVTFLTSQIGFAIVTFCDE
jgi:hypothetical protein